MLDEHNADEASYKKKLKAYNEAYIEFVYAYPFVTLGDSFGELDVDRY
jgi:hypothetical protein